MRQEGELITLLIAPQGGTSTTTPLDIVASNTPQTIANATQIPIYAKVSYHTLGQVTYGEGGKTVLRKISVEAPAQWQSDLQKCYAVKLQNGSVLEKCGEQIDESRALYTLTCEGYVAITE